MADDISVLGIEVESRGVKEGASALDKLAESGKKAEQSTTVLTGSTKKASYEISALAKAAYAAGAAITAQQISRLAKEFIDTADAVNLMNARLKLSTSSQSEFVAVQSRIIALSKDNRAGIAEMAALYTKLAQPIKDAGGGMQETMTIVDSFSKSLKLGGASATEAASATLQFAQAMGSGKLSGDEFRSLAEASPRFMKAIADGIGIPVGALKELSTQGGLTADVVGNALMKMNSQLSSEFKSLPTTVGDALLQVRNELKIAVDDINAASGTTGTLAKSISDLAQEVRPIASIFAEASKGMKDAGDQAGVMNGSVFLLKTTLETLLVVGANVGYVFDAMGREIGGVAAQLTELAKGNFSGAKNIGEMMKSDAEAARKAIDEYSERIIGAYDKAKKASETVIPSAPNAVSNLKPQSTIDAYLKDTSNAPKAAKIAADVEKENKAFQAAVAGLSETDDRYIKALKAHNDRLVEIKKNPEAQGIANAVLTSDLDRIKKENEALINVYAGAERTLEAMRAANLVGDKDYYASKAAFIQLNAQAQEAALNQEIARLEKEKATGKDRIENDKKIFEAKAALSKLSFDTNNATAINAIQEQASISKIAEEYERARISAEAYLNVVRRQSERRVDGLGMGTEYRDVQSERNQIEDRFVSRKTSLDEDLRRKQITKEEYDTYLSIAKESYDKEIAIHAETRDKILAKESDWATGMSEALNNYLDESRNVAKLTERAFTNAFNGLEDALVDFVVTGKASFSDLAESILKDIARITIKENVTGPLASAVKGIDWKSAISGLFSANALGGVYSSPGLSAYSGTIVDKPTVFPFANGIGLMGEKGAEAILPLKRGQNGILGVSSSMPNISVTINNTMSDQAEVSAKPRMNNGQVELEVIVQRVMASDARRNGPITQGMAQTFGIQRSAF